MNHKLFAVHDAKAGAYLPPFLMHRPEMAQRVFADCVNTTTHAFGKNPADYTLFEIGEFDDEKALIKNIDIPVSHGNGLLYLSTTNGTGPAKLTDEERTP